MMENTFKNQLNGQIHQLMTEFKDFTKFINQIGRGNYLQKNNLFMQMKVKDWISNLEWLLKQMLEEGCRYETIINSQNVLIAKDQSKDKNRFPKLTQREIEILQLADSGLTYEQIGKKIFVSRNTIKFHFKNLFLKFGVHRRIELVKIARLCGYLR